MWFKSKSLPLIMFLSLFSKSLCFAANPPMQLIDDAKVLSALLRILRTPFDKVSLMFYWRIDNKRICCLIIMCFACIMLFV